MTILYRLIALLILVLTARNLWEEKRITYQMNAGLVLIPLVLRILMIK